MTVSLPRTDVLALAFGAALIASVCLFGFSLASVGVPAAFLAALLIDGIARPGSGVLHPTVIHGSRRGRAVALTFDDGPDPEVTPAVLDALARHGARATFFAIGRSLQAHPSLARRLAEERHEVANHSWAHSRFQNFFGFRRQLREIERGADAIGGVTGLATAPLYRPPIGLKSPPLARAARRLHLTVVAWSLHSRDTRCADPARVADRVLRKIRPGDIVLMHDGHDLPGRHRPVCAKAVPLILEGLREKGLQCVTVSELLRDADAAGASWGAELLRGLKAHALLKLVSAWLLAGAFFLGYFLLLKFPLWPPTVMPILPLDEWIGFRPGALWLYVSLWVYVPLAPGLLTDRRELLRYYVAVVGLSVAAMAVFLLWPTASPRPPIDWMRHPPFGPLIAADDAGNALPSLHAAFAMFTAIWMDRLLRRADAPAWLRAVNAVWGAGILYSTLATRQHVAVDLISGAALGTVAAALHGRWNEARRRAADRFAR